MRSNEEPSRRQKAKAKVYGLFGVLIFSAGLALYHWQRPLLSGPAFLTVSVVALFLLLLWPTPKHWRDVKHDVLKDPRSYLAILATFVVALAALLGLIGDKDTVALSKLTLAVLAVVAFSTRFDRHKQDRLVEEIRLVSRNASAIKSYTSWHDPEIEELIKSAQETVVIIDSYFMEPEWLAPLIQTAIDRGAKKLDVSIYMLDPEQGFGSQRLREQARERSGKVAKNYEAAYEENLRTCFRLIHNHLVGFAESGVAITTHLYRTMPGMRQIIIDNTEFVFGWFPLGESNPAYTCFHLSDRSLTAGDMKTVANLRRQYKEIADKESTEFDLKNFIEESTCSTGYVSVAGLSKSFIMPPVTVRIPMPPGAAVPTQANPQNPPAHATSANGIS